MNDNDRSMRAAMKRSTLEVGVAKCEFRIEYGTQLQGKFPKMSVHKLDVQIVVVFKS